MKAIKIIVLFIILGLVCNAQVNTIKDLNALLAETKVNDKEKIERLAAKKFDKIISDYRKINGKKHLYWSDTVWIAAKNHNNYMLERSNFTKTNTRVEIGHIEIKGCLNFTGETPKDRYLFSELKNNEDYISCGENVLMGELNSKKNVEEISTDIANLAFKQWKNSAIHNKNMLDCDYQYHAVAFTIVYNKNKVMYFGTDLFITKTLNNLYNGL